MKNFWRIALVLYLSCLFFLCFADSNSFKDTPPIFLFEGADKIVHFLMFFPFPWLCMLWKGRGFKRPSLKESLLIAALGLLLGGATELVQGLLPTRSMDILDFAADCGSIILSTLTLRFLGTDAIIRV